MRCFSAIVLTLAALVAAAPASAADFYVDCQRGDDAASGTSPAEAWGTPGRASVPQYGPGDRILFRRGATCHGVFAPKGSGSPGAPIEATAYGTGGEAVMAGDGARATIALRDVQRWEIRGLVVTNKGPAPQPGDERTAISVANRVTGGGHHYVIEDVTIRDVNTSAVLEPGDQDVENWSKDSGGIIFEAGGRGFDDVQVRDSTLVNVDREGMFFNGPMTGLVVSGNVLRDMGGDGIVTVGSKGALIEGNVVDGYNTLGTTFNAGIWGFASTDAVFQYNDVSHGEHGPLDSMAYDIDGSNHRLVFQYNLSHDNSGGFLMLCNNFTTEPWSAGGANGGSIVRYNISQNDYSVGRGVIDAPMLCSYVNDISIYNNTIVTSDPRISSLVENTGRSSLHFANNIFVGPGPTAPIVDEHGTWDANLYQLVSCAQRPADPRAVLGDPLLVAPGTATARNDAAGYRLRAGSPALGAGVPVPDDGGRDYFGNPIPAVPNIGAYQGPGVSAPAGLLPAPVPAVAPGC